MGKKATDCGLSFWKSGRFCKIRAASSISGRRATAEEQTQPKFPARSGAAPTRRAAPPPSGVGSAPSDGRRRAFSTMDPAAGSNEQMVAAAAAASSGQRAKKLTAEDLMSLHARVGNSMVKLEKTWAGGKKSSISGTIIAATPTYCYVLLHKDFAFDCEIVFLDGARFKMNKADFFTGRSNLAVAKISHGSSTPVQFTERPVSFLDNVYLYVLDVRGLTPGSVVNPTGESKPSHFTGNYFIDNPLNQACRFGSPVFDEVGEFLGIVVAHAHACFVMGASKIKDMLRQELPELARGELISLKVL